MSPKKTFSPSQHFSYVVLTIGFLSLVGALLFGRAVGNVQNKDAVAMRNSCSGQLQMCMKDAETSPECSACSATEGTIRTIVCQTCVAAKANCQNDYNICTDQGGSMHAW